MRITVQNEPCKEVSILIITKIRCQLCMVVEWGWGWDTIPILSPCSNKREMVEGNFVGAKFFGEGGKFGREETYSQQWDVWGSEGKMRVREHSTGWVGRKNSGSGRPYAVGRPQITPSHSGGRHTQQLVSKAHPNLPMGLIST